MRSRKKLPFSSSRIHSKHKTINWSTYNDTLRNRGRIDFMISECLSVGWYEDHDSKRQQGGQRLYSDKAILICLQIRCLFWLKLRQTQGFIDYIFMMSGLELTCPDYTTLSKRGKALRLDSLLGCHEKISNYICIDSTGIQTFTGNEWLESKHGKTYNRRTWKKLHVVTDDNGMIIANSMTSHRKDDRSQFSSLLEGIQAKEILGDSGYDGENIYHLSREKGMIPTIRPPNKLAPKKLKTERKKAIAYQQENCYHAWRNKTKYGRREQVENTFYRFKTSFGSQFLSRDEENMKNELIIKCQLLNRMFEIGKPISVRAS